MRRPQGIKHHLAAPTATQPKLVAQMQEERSPQPIHHPPKDRPFS
ncbi:hypothetical protein [Altericista sp. CCNU0014]